MFDGRCRFCWFIRKALPVDQFTNVYRQIYLATGYLNNKFVFVLIDKMPG